MIAEVDIVLNGAAQEIWRPVLRVGHVEIRSLSEVATAIAWDLDVGGACLNVVDGEVHGLLFAVNLDLDRGQTVAHRAIGFLVEWDIVVKVVCHGSGANES